MSDNGTALIRPSTDQPEKNPRPRRSRAVQKKVYNEFIGRLELQRVWLTSMSMTNHHGPVKPEAVEVEIGINVRWDSAEDAFVSQSRYTVTLRNGETALADIEVVYSAEFACPDIPEDPYLQEFSGRNLQGILWPYLRQLVQELVGRTGWDALVLPTYKI